MPMKTLPLQTCTQALHNVEYCSIKIGSLPARYAKKYSEEGAYGAYVEEIKEDQSGGDFWYVPIIRIFW